MLGKRVNFFYYSGTGNTLLVVEEMLKVFSSTGIEVSLYRIEDTDPRTIDATVPIGLAFPVAFQSTFPFIWKFLKALPKTKGTPIFMVDTMMAFSGAIVGPLKKVMTAKGYNCIGACEIKMPSNWFPKKSDEDLNKKTIENGLEIAKKYAQELIDGKSLWSRIPFLSDALYNICCNNFIMQKVNLAAGRKITVDKEKCMRCGLCAKLCPVHNIEMKDYPQWHNSCEICMRCLSFCPSNAVVIPKNKFQQYRAVKSNKLLNKPNE